MFIKIILYDIWPISINLIYVTCKNNLPLRCHYEKKNNLIVCSCDDSLEQTQYRNKGKGCEGILLQGKCLHNSRKLRKMVAIYKTYKLILSKKISEKSTRKRIEAWKNYLTQKVATQTYFLWPTNYIFYLYGITLSNNNYRRKNPKHNPVRSYCRTHLILFISGVRRSARLYLL